MNDKDNTMILTYEPVTLADLPDYLRKHDLRVVALEWWKRKGAVLVTERKDNKDDV